MGECTEVEKKSFCPTLTPEEPRRDPEASARTGPVQPPSSSPAQSSRLPSEQNRRQEVSGAQRMSQTWTTVVSGKTETEAGSLPCDLEMSAVASGKREFMEAATSRSPHVCSISGSASNLANSKPLEMGSKNPDYSGPLAPKSVPGTCPALGCRLSLMYPEQKRQDTTSHLGKQPGKRRRINRSLLLIPTPQLPVGASHGLSSQELK